MGIFSSNSSWTNQAKANTNEWKCAPQRSSFLGSKKAWTNQSRHRNQMRKDQIKTGKGKPQRTLMGHVADQKSIQKRTADLNRTASRAADAANAAQKGLDKAIRSGNPGAVKRATAKAVKAQKDVTKAQRAARRG